MAGVAFKITFSYAGFEMQPKQYTDPKIALLNIELELKAERDNAEVRLENVEVINILAIMTRIKYLTTRLSREQEYQKVVDAEWTILYDKLEKLHLSGAKVVLPNFQLKTSPPSISPTVTCSAPAVFPMKILNVP